MAVVRIQGAVKATRTSVRKDANKDPLVVGQVVLEFDMDGAGTTAMQELLELLDSEVFALITNIQMELPLVGNGKK